MDQTDRLITDRDIYSFYYLTYLYQTNRLNMLDEYTHFVVEDFLLDLKRVYLKIFTNLVREQLIKYNEAGRVQLPLSKSAIKAASIYDLASMMVTTYRSDMKRKNTRWQQLCNLLIDLNYTAQLSSIIHCIDRINNVVHNTKKSILDKLPDAESLLAAFDACHQAKHPDEFSHLVYKDIRTL